MRAYQNDDWIVGDFGMRSKMIEGTFDIPAERLAEMQSFPTGPLLFWPVHMANETWFSLDSFIDAYKHALSAHQGRYPMAVPLELLEDSVKMARQTTAKLSAPGIPEPRSPSATDRLMRQPHLNLN